MAERPEVDELTIEECSSENGVIIIATINRPEKLNALNIDVKEAIKSLCAWAQESDEVLVVVFRGASPLPPPEGKRQKPHAFVAGAMSVNLSEKIVSLFAQNLKKMFGKQFGN